MRLEHQNAGKTASPIEEGEALCRRVGHTRHVITALVPHGVQQPWACRFEDAEMPSLGRPKNLSGIYLAGNLQNGKVDRCVYRTTPASGLDALA